MTKTLRVGVVGAGYFAQFHLDAWQRMPDVDLVAVAERDAAKGHEAAERFGIANVYPSLAELLEAETVDLIDIATPPDTHLDAIRQTAERGIDTVCQKPFCGGLSGAREALALADAAGIQLIVHENFRFQPWYRAIKNCLANGALGTVYQLQFRMRPGDGQGPDAYLGRQPYFQKMPRFLVHETAIHFIDVFRFLLGEPKTVYADLMRLNPIIAGEDAGLIVLGFDDGLRAVFDGNRLADHPAENTRLTMGDMIIDAERGSIRLDGNGQLYQRGHGDLQESPIPFSWVKQGFAGDSVFLFQQAVIDALRTGTRHETDAASYLENLKLVDAVYQSNESGQRVTL